MESRAQGRGAQTEETGQASPDFGCGVSRRGLISVRGWEEEEGLGCGHTWLAGEAGGGGAARRRRGM